MTTHITAICGACGHEFQAHVATVGRVGNCPHCGEEIRVKRAEGRATPAPPPTPEPPPQLMQQIAFDVANIRADLRFITGVAKVVVAIIIMQIVLMLIYAFAVYLRPFRQ